jgi:hypothetical protein
VKIYEHLDGTLSIGYGPHSLARYDREGRLVDPATLERKDKGRRLSSPHHPVRNGAQQKSENREVAATSAPAGPKKDLKEDGSPYPSSFRIFHSINRTSHLL